MTALPANLPSLLLSRPKRVVIENKKDEHITLSASQGRPLAYLVTGCENCSFDFRQACRLSQILFEDCENLVVDMCPVIGSTDLVKCEKVEIRSTASAGTICIDMSVEVRLIGDDPKSDWLIYTSSSSRISIELTDVAYRVPADLAKTASRSKTWLQDGTWHSAVSNMYGDIVSPT